MEAIYVIALLLLIIGGINWALVGLFDYNLVASLFGNFTATSRTIYAAVGLAALTVAILSDWSPREDYGAGRAGETTPPAQTAPR